jgi:hypothetical protein
MLAHGCSTHFADGWKADERDARVAGLLDIEAGSSGA